MKRSIALFLAVILLAASLLIACGSEEYEAAEDGEIYVHFLDVGQADCTLLRTKETAILVDVGDFASAERVADYLEELEIETIDCVMLTHPHDDHIGGAEAIFSRFAVRECILPSIASDTPAFRALLDVLEQGSVAVKEGYRGEVFRYGDISVELLWPTEYPMLTDENARSLVFRAAFGANTLLFCGDAPASVEHAVLELDGEGALRAQILKVGHHGASTSTTEPFLSAVSPQYAVISCGRGNAYAYPHIELMTRLLAAEAKIYRTDTDGTIVFRGNGASFSVLEK